MPSTDDDSAKKLGQPMGGAWDRSLHAQFVDRLTREGARMLFYDIVFDTASADPAVDETFALALRQNGRVILGAAVDETQPLGGVGGGRDLDVAQRRVLPPLLSLRKAAAFAFPFVFANFDPFSVSLCGRLRRGPCSCKSRIMTARAS